MILGWVDNVSLLPLRHRIVMKPCNTKTTERTGQESSFQVKTNYARFANCSLTFASTRASLRFTSTAITMDAETSERERRYFKPPLQTDCELRFERFRQQPPKSSFKKLILETALIKGLQSMSDKLCPKGLKDFEVERAILNGHLFRTYLWKMTWQLQW